MKKLILTLAVLGQIAFFSLANAQIYIQVDYCGDYYDGCSAVVTKCRFDGAPYCVISGQIPGEMCGPSGPVIGG